MSSEWTEIGGRRKPVCGGTPSLANIFCFSLPSWKYSISWHLLAWLSVALSGWAGKMECEIRWGRRQNTLQNILCFIKGRKDTGLLWYYMVQWWENLCLLCTWQSRDMNKHRDRCAHCHTVAAWQHGSGASLHLPPTQMYMNSAVIKRKIHLKSFLEEK